MTKEKIIGNLKIEVWPGRSDNLSIFFMRQDHPRPLIIATESYQEARELRDFLSEVLDECDEGGG